MTDKTFKSFKQISHVSWGIDLEPGVYPGHERVALGFLQRLVEGVEHFVKPKNHLLWAEKDGCYVYYSFFSEEWPHSLHKRNIGYKAACILGKWETNDLREALAVLDTIDFPKLVAGNYKRLKKAKPYSKETKNLRRYLELLRIYRLMKKTK